MASQPFSNGMCLHVEINVAPENVEKFLSALKYSFDHVVKEPKCLSFEALRDQERPGRFVLVENWDCTPEWFEKNQLTKEYYKPYLEATEPMWTKPRVLTYFERMPSQWAVARENVFQKL